MPTKDFRRDLTLASSPGRFTYLNAVDAGEIDGSISFTFTEGPSGPKIDFQAIVPDPHEYPSSHTFFVYSTSDNVTPAITKAVEDATPLLRGSSLHDIGHEDPMEFDRSDVDNDLADDYDSPGWSDEDQSGGVMATAQKPSNLRGKIRHDLRLVKNANFKVGYIGHLAGAIIISVAIRIGQLGISDEAMTAWNVCPGEYLVLLLRYPTYMTQEMLYTSSDRGPQIRVGLCNSYKPSTSAAIASFQDATSGNEEHAKPECPSGPLLRELFIGAPLHKLLNERLLGIVKVRLRYGLSWTGAEVFFHNSQGKVLSPDDAKSEQFQVPDSWVTPAPPFLLVDHLADMGLDVPGMSFPLIAMQFLLRHFVRCTEFCLVCHCKTYDDFEAVKPYVCSSGLCLFQYITFGMGTSLEYELRHQPYVVDLLISLAYARAKAGLLMDFPTGLGLNVPDTGVPDADQCTYFDPDVNCSMQGTWKAQKTYKAAFNLECLELSHAYPPKVKVGNWIVILDLPSISQDRKVAWHCRVLRIGETSGHIFLSPPVSRGRQIPKEIAQRYPISKVTYVIYNTNFDDLKADRKRKSIVMLLSMLPSVDLMTSYLGQQDSGKLLSSWRDQFPPAALDLVRWVVASNRSCIMQDTNDPEHLVTGMGGFIQFRLVQGAPDKEQRFIQEINANSMASKPAYRTIFAWHGSPVHNWHSILREGLHFKQIAHARAYGNGVYFSKKYQISAGYCHNSSSSSWPQSQLNIQSIISLNEVVNNPSQFKSVTPHFVVPQLDWIQPRYLFVNTGHGKASTTPAAPSAIYRQDPQHEAYGPSGEVVKIPISAITSKRRKQLVTSPKTTSAKKKSDLPVLMDIDGFNDALSVTTEIEDLNILLSDSDYVSDSEDEASQPPKGSSSESDQSPCPKTDFVPGTLNGNTLPLLAPPQYASTPATKLLQKHLRSTLKTQATEPLHELGWYLDPNLITTVYQWIVELHSFDPSLPLARDLKACNRKSILLEIRFPPQFPMDPPLCPSYSPTISGICCRWWWSRYSRRSDVHGALDKLGLVGSYLN
ncbi:hypothetical protein N7462_001623 [Penicillium macrosclerotiorum]|uniref:uncharacterized protein n=1 Tax=Penicillium macrosclerotiorum TaxID=303699 RepID=UPI0025499DE7|nr:uncharacterized protein N7462_001623 [Penicillium macrosclerotiorum]KAJ5692200.1 hypothetical protein N7462_001623 [Penicillium macrosclerotiorum]